jgi:5-methylcytosine-specific restriction protein B
VARTLGSVRIPFYRSIRTLLRNDVKALWQFLSEMSIGDVIFAKCGTRIIVGRGIVESDYFFDSQRTEYWHVRRVKWTHRGKWLYLGKPIRKMLTDITPATEIEACVLAERRSAQGNP